jgi:hypothetical protein
MSVICITITQSAEQVVSGIPKTVSVTTNIPATIFFTLDGSVPNLFSTMYVGPIFIPYNQLVVNLQVFATNGTISSPVISECYQTNIVNGNARLPHAATTAQPGSIIPDSYPFGTPPYQPNQGFLNPALSGITVFNPALPAQPTGFNYDGYGAGYSNKPYDTLNYQIIYGDTNAEGEMGYGIGNIPGNVVVPVAPKVPEETNQFKPTFNPKALVVFQNFNDEDPNDPPQINSQFFSMEDVNVARDGDYFFQSGTETVPPSASFIRSSYNPRTQEITCYYRDSFSNRWLISTAPYQPNRNPDLDLAAPVFGRNNKVFEWIPFARRVLF